MVESRPSTPPTPAKRQRVGEAKDGKSENVVVCVRVRPRAPSSIFPPRSSDETWLLDPSRNRISLSDKHPIIRSRGTGTAESVHGSEGYAFDVDSVFPPSSETEALYGERVSPVVRSAMEGFNGTVFAYGQTGSGKTFTMMGNEDSPGVIPQAVEEMFQVIREEGDAREFLLRVSYLEIYNETLRDLLYPEGSGRLDIRVDKGKVQVSGLKEEVVTHPMQVLETIARGERARHVGATDWNERSSRSHTVFSVTIESRERTATPDLSSLPTSSSLSRLASCPAPLPAGTRVSSLNLIDLAGSESAASSSERRKEGAFINKSLLALGTVIAKLTERGAAGAHIPYRDSKLTRLLQTSLGGNAKVAVICTISPDAHHAVESVGTLRFARRAKMVVTKAERGTTLDSQSALLQKYQQEILELRSRLLSNEASIDDSLAREKDEETRRLDGLKDERKRAEEDIAEMQLQRIRLQEQIEHLNRRILTGASVDANVRRAGLEHADGMTPARRGRISALGASPLGGGGGAGGGRNILDVVSSPRAKELTDLRHSSVAKDQRIEALEADLASFKSRLQLADSQAEKARTAFRAQGEMLAAVETSVLSLESTLARVRKEKQDLVDEQDQTRGVTTSQAEKVARLEEQVAELAEELDTANAEKTTAAKVANERAASSSALEAEARVLRIALTEAESSCGSLGKQLKRRISELETERAANASLRNQLKEAVEVQKATEGERDQIRREAEELSVRLAEVEELVQAEREESRKAAADLASGEETKRRELEGVQSENRILRIDLENVKAQLFRIKDEQRHSIQVTSLTASRRGPNTEGLKAKLAALQKRQNATPTDVSASPAPTSAPGSSGSASPPREGIDALLVLQATVEEQKATIKQLEADLAKKAKVSSKTVPLQPAVAQRVTTASGRERHPEIDGLKQAL